MNSTLLSSRYFGTHRQCFAAANLTWPTYVDGNVTICARINSKPFLIGWINSLWGPFTVATYTFACLRSTTQSNVWANIDDGHMGTLNKIGWELFIILWNDPNVHTDTNYFCMKEYIAYTKHKKLHITGYKIEPFWSFYSCSHITNCVCK